MNQFLSACWLTLTLVSAFPVSAANPEPTDTPQRLYDEGVPETGFLTLKTDNYTLPLDAASGWTIDKMLYDDYEFGLNNGQYGTVLRPKGQQWWGTGHKEGGREVVHRLQLIVDGKETPITKTSETITGKRIEFIKESTIWKFKVRAEIILTNSEIFERTQMEALEDVDLDLLYYFMHSFPPTSTKWMVQLPDGTIETGPLAHSKKMAVNKDTTWVAQFNPEQQLSSLCYTPRVIAGNQSASMIWDLDRYHKYYLRHNNGQSFKKGDQLDFTVIVKAIPKETGNWQATKKAAESLMKQFPAEKQTSEE
ncbi:hypothetical protein [Gimesia sp.]|uniref:hypothetical protein n=1 Tax=Gimesia sp. TaxID=2024833 RepID=UPI000C617136|nr:hypothetical protein [Gimesia sp.]MAX35025.1 hypothetical protein [Gimesia sp.]HAH49711.1 hypothetical protein [Planctomycetaceae bacterium]|tara:strand:- start:2888 stop:3811 length:924 start_codon:yes stop_codon:yes gene_type:complete